MGWKCKWLTACSLVLKVVRVEYDEGDNYMMFILVARTQHFTGPECQHSFCWFRAKYSIVLINSRHLNQPIQKISKQYTPVYIALWLWRAYYYWILGCSICMKQKNKFIIMDLMKTIPWLIRCWPRWAIINQSTRSETFTLQRLHNFTPWNVSLFIFMVFQRSSEYGWHPSTKILSKETASVRKQAV